MKNKKNPNNNNKDKNNRNSNNRSIRWFMVSVVLLCMGLGLVWANASLECNIISVYSDRLPAAFDGYRIAQVSDLHNAEFGNDNEMLIQMLKDSNADLIVLTGDLVDSSHTDFDVAVRFAEKAVQMAPTYYVTGNHEAWLGQAYDMLENRLEQIGVEVMREEAVYVEQDGDRILLLGIDDPEFYEREATEYDGGASRIQDVIDGLRYREDEYTIVLSHRPELFDAYVDAKVDLVFSGHAHGGQFRLPIIGGLVAPGQGLFPSYDSGLYSQDITCMVVSRGLGNSVIPLRICNRPEVVVVELHSNIQ